ncbi:MAG TPA: S8 family serine peptidase, partial [Phycisphaerae bacterium]|nr:S8 family serine peptidase [Phycisphaerae bacterium]
MWWRRPFGNRIKSRNLLTVANLKRTARGGRRPLQLEALEERTLLDVGGLLQADMLAGFSQQEVAVAGQLGPSSVAMDARAQELIDAITTTGSTQPIYVGGEVGEAGIGGLSPATAESTPQINLAAFRADARFAGIDGSGFATVILDTGIDLNHPFFGPDVAPADGIADRIVYSWDFADGDPDASDVNGHGSNVSSIVASEDATYPGMAPGADIIHLKVFEDGGDGNFGYIEAALQWVVDNVDKYNIASINMSCGDEQNYTTPQTLYGISDELAALEAMDVMVVSSSGNGFATHESAQGVAYPSADPSSLSVGAVYDGNTGGWTYSSGAIANSTDVDRIAPFSQRHETLTTVMAPGAVITGADDSAGDADYHGTSQASPHISGIAVLAQQLAVQEMGRRLTQTEYAGLLQTTGVTINDGDDEDDNVTNTGLDFPRVDVLALGDAIYAMAHLEVDADDDPGGDNVADSGVDDVFLIKLNAAGTDVEVYINGDLFTTAPLGDLNSITVNGSDDSDKLIVDFSNGSPIPAGGIDFQGGLNTTGPGDTLELTDGTFDTITHYLDAAGEGSVELDGVIGAITYTGLEPISDMLVGTTRIMDFGAGNDADVHLFDPDPADDTVRVEAPANAELVDVNTTGMTNLVINLGAGNDRIEVERLGSGFGAAIAVNGEGDDDTLVVNNAQGLVVTPGGIVFDGGGGANSLVIEGDPAPVSVERETYASGPAIPASLGGPFGPHDGAVVLDPDDVPALGGMDGDEELILFFNLSPVVSVTPAGQLDVFATPGPETINVVDGAGFGGFTTTRVSSGGALFESYEFANKGIVSVNGLDGADTITVNNPNAATGLSDLFVLGNELTGGILNLDDNAADQLNVDGTAASVTTWAFGQGGSDSLRLGSSGTLDNILGPVTIDGGVGWGDGAYVLDPYGTAQDPTITLTDADITGVAGGVISYANVNGLLFYTTEDFDTTVDVLSTALGTDTQVCLTRGAHAATVTVGNETANFGDGTGNLDAIVGTLGLIFNDGVSRLQIDDTGDATGDTASIADNGTYTGIDGFSPQSIMYLTSPGNKLDDLVILAGSGGNTIDVDDTTATSSTAVDSGIGSDSNTVTINADGLTGDNIFTGNTGNDRFVLNVTADVGGASLLIEGNDPAGDPANRDVLEINDLGGGARNLTFGYPTTVNGDLTVSGFAIPVNVRSMETVSYDGDASNDDTVLVAATPTADALTVTPTGPNSADVTIDGGVGASLGPDLALSGLNATTGLTIDGNLPAFPGAPGDRDVLYYDGGPAATLMVLGPGAGKITEPGSIDANYLSIEEVQSALPMTVVVTADADPGPNEADNGVADDFLVQLDGSGNNVQVFVNGTLVFDSPTAHVATLLIEGSDDDDTLTVDNAQGLVVLLAGIIFDADAGANTLMIEGDPGIGIAREWYVTGPSVPPGPPLYGPYWASDGFIVFDPDDSAAQAGGMLGLNGDEQIIGFFDLAPIYDTTPAVQLDIALTPAGDTANVVDGPGIGPFTTTEINDGGTAAFESIEFANKQVVTVNGLDGADTFVVDNPNPATGLLTLELYGNELTGGTLESDDGAADRFDWEATGAAVGWFAFGQGGNDVFDVEKAGNVDEILGDVTVDGGAGDDALNVDDRTAPSSATTEGVTITNTMIVGITGPPGAIPSGDITYQNLGAGTVTIWTNDDPQIFTVRSTAAGLAETELNTGGGDDFIQIKDAFGMTMGVVSPVDLNAGAGSRDELRIEDFGDAFAREFHMDATTIGGGAFNTPVAPGGIFGPGGILFYDQDLEDVDVYGPDGPGLDNIYNIDATGMGLTEGWGALAVLDGEGDGTFYIQGNTLSAAASHFFSGDEGIDAFRVYLDAGTVIAGTYLDISGGDPVADSSNRDLMRVIDAGGARQTDIHYLGMGIARTYVQIDAGTLLRSDAVEQIVYVGDAASDDSVTVEGTAMSDDLTVAPLSTSSALVFLGGNPWDGPIEGDWRDQFPGVAGGSDGPDLHLMGLGPAGVNVTGGGAGAAGDQLYVYAPSEEPLFDAATTSDPFGFGQGVIIPGFGTGGAYDQIEVDDTRVDVVNNSVGRLVPVNVDTPTFAPAPGTIPGLIVNAGFEAAPAAATGLADDIHAALSFNFAIQINGGDPVPAFAPQGDRLEVTTPAEVNIFSDKTATPNVTINSAGSMNLTWSSIEHTILTPGAVSQTVNIYGDNDDPLVDQPDNYVIVGA